MSLQLHPLALATCLAAACTGQPPRTPADPPAARTVSPTEIRGRTWVLTALKGSAVTAGARGAPTLQLSLGDLQATGFGGCNRLAGPYTLDGAALSFGPLVSTRMACPDAMDLEAAFSVALEAVRGWRLAGDDLELTAGDTVLVTLRRR